MYESLYRSQPGYVMPSGFYLKFAQTGWTPLFGTTGANNPKKWSVAEVVGGEAQLFGVTFDTKGQADFLSFYMCGGGLSTQPVITGCTKPTAINYSRKATKDDGSCKFIVVGCMDKRATNFNPKATKQISGSCKYIRGCMNSKATNYNAQATVNDGSCVFPIPVVPTYGCMDKLALNFNPKATVENGSCKFKKKIPTKTTGCFNGPMAGKFVKETSNVVTVRAKPWCRIVNIQSCN